MAYTITLHFTAGDHSYTVLRDGYKLNRLVGAKGRHATQGCQLKIRSHEASILLLQELCCSPGSLLWACCKGASCFS